MNAAGADAIIVAATVAPGHDGVAELLVRLRHPNGGEDTVTLEAEIGFRLMQRCGAADPDGLAGQSWRRMLDSAGDNGG